ncbi:DMT family transporter [Asaia bogorensis]|uniref:ABC transporter permease n=1 Tax=Asaia bogorensis NBRC 16594 TaxID=1231624 RepID=A0AAN4U1J2_9PROT|nr:DMT family transporter [Asaia bogorensis]BAT20008.1 EamA-like transporter family domain protein [Asaia bogorensis NBRC 16594]GBQ80788.1 permease [Asaia bogorensis NBRC 16594]GEL52574.1 ABC transporter permease [Asaia bogorensis NBRC 16594]
MQKQHQNHMGPKEWSLLLILALLWGGSFFFFKILVSAVPPFSVVLGRVGLAALALNLLLVVRRTTLPLDRTLWLRLFVLGLLNNVIPFSAIAFGETRISSGLAAILNATTPVFTIIVAHFLTHDEKMRLDKVAGIVLGFCGVGTLIAPALAGGGLQSSLAGELACLGAALSYGFGGVYGRKFRGLPALQIATGQLTASTILILPLSMLVDHPWTLPPLSATVWGAFAGIALLSTAGAFILYFKLLATSGATNLSLVTFLLPIMALMLGILFLGEHPGWYALAGLCLIGAGLAAIDGRLFRLVTDRATTSR